MNFKISKKVFYSSLQTVSRAISSNSPIPSLTGIKIDVLEDSIVLTGSDSDISIQKILTANDEDINLVISETGSIVIEAKYILEIVRKIDADEIDLRIVDGSLTKISGNNAKFEINGVRAIDYPTLDFTKPSQQFELDADVLVKVEVKVEDGTKNNEEEDSGREEEDSGREEEQKSEENPEESDDSKKSEDEEESEVDDDDKD